MNMCTLYKQFFVWMWVLDGHKSGQQVCQMGGLQTLQWLIKHAQSAASDKQSQSHNKTAPPVSAALHLQILSVWECVCGCVEIFCVCVPCVSGSEKLISTQATSKWVRKAERECEMHACVSSVKCLSNSRYHADSCQWYRSLGGRLWLVRQGV